MRGLVINGFFTGSGIALFGADNVLVGNFIGTDPTGLVAQGNGGPGIAVGPGEVGTVTGSIIGGATPAARNLLSGNAAEGLQLNNATNSVIYGNIIGANATGAAPLGMAMMGYQSLWVPTPSAASPPAKAT